MSIHGQVSSAIENAPIVATMVESMNNYAQYADEPDNHPITFNAELLPDASNEITTDIALPSGLRNIIETYVDVTGTKLVDGYIDYAERHENQHFSAAQHLGAKAARVGIRVVTIQPENGAAQTVIQPFLRLQNFQTTKLGMALVSAYPLPPSKGDTIDVGAFGYSGVDELAEIATRRNIARRRKRDQFYPVPLSAGTGEHSKSFYIPSVPRFAVPQKSGETASFPPSLADDIFTTFPAF